MIFKEIIIFLSTIFMLIGFILLIVDFIYFMIGFLEKYPLIDVINILIKILIMITIYNTIIV